VEKVLAGFVVVVLASRVVLGLLESLSSSFSFVTPIQRTFGACIQALSAAATGDLSSVYHSNLSIGIGVWVSSGVPWLTLLLVEFTDPVCVWDRVSGQIRNNCC